MSDSYWLGDEPKSASPELENASYWVSDFANTVYSTGSTKAKLGSKSKQRAGTSKDVKIDAEGQGGNSGQNQASCDSKLMKKSQSDDVGKARESQGSGEMETDGPTRDPRRRKRPSSSNTTLSIASKQRELPPDRPSTITQRNIDQHRIAHENSYEWSLRRQFLLEHCENIDSAQLECLSQVFINVEVYGCRYPVGVMNRVRELSSHIEDLHAVRAKRKERNQIKFVKESQDKDDIDSAERVDDKTVFGGGGSGKGKDSKKATKKPIAFVRPTTTVDSKEAARDVSSVIRNEKPSTSVASAAAGGTGSGTSGGTGSTAGGTSAGIGEDSGSSEETFQQRKAMYARNKVEEAVYDLADALERVISEKKSKTTNSIEILYMASNKSKISLGFDYTMSKKQQECVVLMDSVVVGSGGGKNKKLAKHAAYENAVEKLSKPYLRVVRVNPERQALEASDVPYKEVNQMSGLAVLGGGEVARRGMRPQQKPTQKLDQNDFVLIDNSHKQEQNAATILQQSADFNKVQLQWVYDENPSKSQVCCKLYIDHVEFESFTASNQKLAKINVSEKALERLQNTNWTIKIKSCADTKTSGLTRDQLLGDLSEAAEALPESNIGSKLLKKMGWTGGGVGKTGQGITVPIKADTTLIRREGFGLSQARGLGMGFKSKVKSILIDYCRSDRQDDLQFTPEFSSEERALVHTEARKLGLRSKSYGQGEDRYLVVGRKRSPTQLFHHIMAQGGSTSKYELVAPQSG